MEKDEFGTVLYLIHDENLPCGKEQVGFSHEQEHAKSIAKQYREEHPDSNVKLYRTTEVAF